MQKYHYVLIKDKEPTRQRFDSYDVALQAYNDAIDENPMLFKEYFLGGTIQIL